MPNYQSKGQVGVATQADQGLRLDKTDRRGQYFESPVLRFYTTTGAANTGAQVIFRVAFTKGVQGIQILRNVSKDYGSAKLLQTYPMAPQATGAVQPGRDISYHDSDPSTFGKTVNYFLKVLPLHENFQPIVEGPVAVAVP
jgi:hypothetical protein